jgi:DNA-binding MarR family transcriptional regulator
MINKTTLSETCLDLYKKIESVNHTISLLRQNELNQHEIPLRQLHVLRAIQVLGSNATLSQVAERVERESHVISRQTALMERDGLIKRNKVKPKTNLLKLELTEKGIDMIKDAECSESIDAIFSSLTQTERQQLESTLIKIQIKAKEYASIHIKIKGFFGHVVHN